MWLTPTSVSMRTTSPFRIRKRRPRKSGNAVSLTQRLIRCEPFLKCDKILWLLNVFKWYIWFPQETKPAVKKETKATPALHKKRPGGGVTKRRPRPRFTVLDSGRKSIRTSTAIKTQATKIRLKELDDARKRKKKKVRVEDYMPTQEELLEEAKITEEENTKSLGGYLKQPRKQLFYNLLVHSQRNSRKWSWRRRNHVPPSARSPDPRYATTH